MIPTDTNMPNQTNEHIHHGRNVKRFREMLGLKQEGLAYELGDDWTQKRVSLLEQKESIDGDLLGQVAKALKVPVEAIKNFDEEAAIVYLNTFNDNSVSHVIGNYGTYNFNPIDKWIETLEENRKLYKDLLREKDEKIALLERMLEKK
ncbi:MAG: helix-turn-helix transcriptional regulator [Ferruginibacter sp.]